MARPTRKPRTSDRIVAAIRDRLLAAGTIEVVADGRGRYRSTRVIGITYGPGHTSPPGATTLRVHAGRGRPPAGSIGLVAAIATATRYSERVVLRALAGTPRTGTRRALGSACPLCGHDPQGEAPRVVQDAPAEPSPAGRGLDAIACTISPPPPRDPVDLRWECRAALMEALDAALAMGCVDGREAAVADSLRDLLGGGH
jgi:hypothetical protein